MNSNLFPVFIKDHFFTEDEENTIWKGLEMIHKLNLFSPPQETGSATENGVPIKKNIGYFIKPNEIENDDIKKLYYVILKVFSGTTNEYSNLDFWTKSILMTKKHDILISYYEDKDCYPPHIDESFFTVLIWFYKRPRKFLGGDLFLHDIEKEIEVKNNRLTIIPSQARHSVSEIKMEHDILSCEKNGRYCITLFLR